MLVRPLIARELIRECRSRSHFVGRTLFAAALAGLIIFHWSQTRIFDEPIPRPAAVRPVPPGGAAPSRARPPVGQISERRFAQFGAELFGLWAVGQFAAVVLLATVRSVTLAEERRLRSLDVLRTTSVGDEGLLLGTWLSVLGRAGFVMLLGMPVLFICRSFGGFTADHVLGVGVVTLVAASTASALTLAVGSMSTSGGAAAGMSVFLQGAWLWLTYADTATSAGVNALAAVVQIGGAKEVEDAPLAMLLCLGVVAPVLGFHLTKRLLKREPLRMGALLKRALVAADRFFEGTTHKRRLLWRGGLGPCRGNPVLWRERVVSVLGQRDHVIRLYYWMMLASLASALVVMPFGGLAALEGLVLFALVGAPFVVYVLLLVFVPGGTFGRERQQRTLTLLAGTPLSAGRILLGKYLFSLRIIVLPVAVGVGMAAVVHLVGYGGFLALSERMLWSSSTTLSVLSLLGLSPLVAALLLYVGAAARQATQGMTAAVVLTLAAFVFWHPTVALDLLRRLDVPDMDLLPAVLLPALGGALLVAAHRPGVVLRTVAAILFLMSFKVAYSLLFPAPPGSAKDFFPTAVDVLPFAAIHNVPMFLHSVLPSFAAAAVFYVLILRQLDALMGRNG
jgi:hypothetical protein